MIMNKKDKKKKDNAQKWLKIKEKWLKWTKQG